MHASYRLANGMAIVFSQSDKESLDLVEKWLDDISDHDDPNICKVLIGIETDLNAIKIPQDRIKAIA